MKDGGTALKWGIGIMLYLIIYFFIVLSVSNGLSAMHQTTTIRATDVFGTGLVSGCAQPRIIDNVSYTGSGAASLSCTYITTETVCNATISCAYSGLLQSCLPASSHLSGTDAAVPLSYLYLNPASVPEGTYASYRFWDFDIGLFDKDDNEVSLSGTPRLSNDKTVCEAFGFTWYTQPTFIDTQSDFAKVKTALSTMFGFSASYCEDSDTMCQTFATYFALLFTWLPTIALIICVYLLVPLI